MTGKTRALAASTPQAVATADKPRTARNRLALSAALSSVSKSSTGSKSRPATAAGVSAMMPAARAGGRPRGYARPLRPRVCSRAEPCLLPKLAAWEGSHASLVGDSCRRFYRRLGGSKAAALQVQPSGGHRAWRRQGRASANLCPNPPSQKLRQESLRSPASRHPEQQPPAQSSECAGFAKNPARIPKTGAAAARRTREACTDAASTRRGGLTTLRWPAANRTAALHGAAA